MQLQVLWCSTFLLVEFLVTLSEGILCYSCSSEQDMSCMHMPPPPINCSQCIRVPSTEPKIHDIDIKELTPNASESTECPNCDTNVVQSATQPRGECVTIGLSDFCMVTKTYDDNGTLVGITRGCSPIMTLKNEECYEAEDSEFPGRQARVCMTICNTDGCNTADTVYHTMLWTYVVTVFWAVSKAL